MNFVGLLAVPPGVVMDIVTAPAASSDGTAAVTCDPAFQQLLAKIGLPPVK